jgi:hypothetical protein
VFFICSGEVLVVHGGESITGVNLFDLVPLLVGALGCFDFKPVVCVVFVYFWRSGAAVSWRCACECSYVSMNIHVFLENSQEHQEDDEQCGGDNRPHFVLVGIFLYA